MPSNYGGTIEALKALLPVHVNIAAIANTTPVAVTTSTPHGCETGDTAVIDGVIGFTGGYEVLVTSVATLVLVGTTAVGASGAVGTLRCAGFGSDIQLPSDTDFVTAAAFNAAYEALADRTALLMYQTQYEQAMHPGGKFVVFADASIEVRNNGQISLLAGSTIFSSTGTLSGDLGMLGTMRLLSPSTFEVQSGATEAVRAGGFLNIFGAENIESGGQLINLSGGLIDIKGDGSVSPGSDGDVIFRGGAMLEMKSGAVVQLDPGAMLLLNGASSGATNLSSTWHGVAHVWDNCTQTFTSDSNLVGTKIDNCTNTFTGVQTQQGPTIYSGDTGYIAHRPEISTSNSTGTEHIDAWKTEYVELGATLAADVSWVLSDPPNGERVGFTINATHSRLNGNSIVLKNSGGSTIVSIPTPGQGSGGDDVWLDIRWNGGSNRWFVIRAASFYAED